MDKCRDPVEENLTNNPGEEVEKPAAAPPADAVWNPENKTEMEIPLPAAESTEMETTTTLQMLAIPIRVGAKPPTNLNAGVPMDLYVPASIAILMLGATRVTLGLHRRK